LDHRPWLRAVAVLAALVAGSAAPGQAPFRFAGGSIPGEAGGVLGLADFDADGDLDLLTNGTGVYLNDGHAHFTPHPVLANVVVGGGGGGAYVFPPKPPVAIGDLNGDYLPDVIAFSPAMTIQRWINQGAGILLQVPGGNPAAPGIVTTIALADVDGDSDRDIMLASVNFPTCNWSPPTALRLWRNDGSAGFAQDPWSVLPFAISPHQIALHDMDGDGDADLVVGGDNSTGTSVLGPMMYPNDGLGGFASAGMALPAPGPMMIGTFALGDVNGDGAPDILLDYLPLPVCSGPSSPVLLLNGGNGASFVPAASGIPSPPWGVPLMMDLDADGGDDIVRLTYHGIAVHLMAGGNLGPPTTVLPLAATPHSNAGIPGSWPGLMIAPGDVDGDGDEDIVVLTNRGNEILFNDSIKSLVARPHGLAPSRSDGAYGRRTGDAVDGDGDGDLDLPLGFATCAPGGPETLVMRVAVNDGSGNLSETSIPCSGVTSSLLALETITDLDGDGDLDAAVVPWRYPPQDDNVVEILTAANGSISVTQSITLPAAADVSALCAGDIDGDGDRDLVAAMIGTFGSAPAPTFVLRNEPGGFSIVPSVTGTNLPDAFSHEVALVDVDGDLDLDLVQANAVPGPPCALGINDGTGNFTPSPGIPYWRARRIAHGDVDGDGDEDLVLDHAIMLNSGAGTFSFAGYFPIPGWPASSYVPPIGLFDVDGDGDPDLVEAEGRLYRNGGGTLLFGAPEPLPAKLAAPIVHADFDGDGDEDLVARGPRILSNVTRHLAPCRPLRPGRPGSIEVSGSPGESFLLVASTGQATVPMPPLGTIRLDLAAAQPFATGAIGPTGTATVTAITPTTPGIVGFTLSWQALVTEPAGPRLTGLVVTTVGAF
jgi:hypothetical protein